MERGEKVGHVGLGRGKRHFRSRHRISPVKKPEVEVKSQFILFYFIWHKKEKIVGPDRVSGRASRAFLNRFRVCSREVTRGTKREGVRG